MSEVGEKFVFAEELSGGDRGRDSVREIKSLMEESVRNDQKRAERTRVLGETLPLARAIEGKFGSGSYKDVMTTTNENAGLRRKWLERKLSGQKEH